MPHTPPKILLLSPHLPPNPGGVAQAVWRHAHQLHRAGLNVEVWGLSSGEVPPAPFPIWRPGLNSPVLRGLSDLESARLHGPSPDLIHGYYLSASAELALALGTFWQVPVVLAARGNDLDRDLWIPERRERLLNALPQAAALSGVSQALTQQLRVLAPACPQIRWVPNSVDSQHFAPLPRQSAFAEQWGIPLAGTRWGFVGELRQKKGMALLLLAFQTLAEKYADLSLLLVGEVRQGPDRQLLTLFRKQNPALNARLIEIPSLPHAVLPDLYAWLDLLVFPSLQEGLSNACMEALSCARPVVATTVGGFPDLIEDGREGRLIPPYQLEPLIRALEEAYLHPARAQAWGEAGRIRMQQAFRPEQELANWLALYQAAGLKIS